MVAPSLQITSLTNIFNLLLIVLPMFSTVAALRSKLYLPNCRIRFSVHRPVRQRNVASISNRLYLKSRDSKALCCRKEYSSSGVISINRGGSQANVSTIDKATRECVFDEYYRVYIAVGANVGDRFNNLMKGISMMRDTTREDIPSSKSPSEENENDTPLIRIIGTSFLRETPPMYVTDQPSFLNGAVEIETRLSPHALLRRLKDVEVQIGRDLDGMRYGPRPIDLDIIYYGVDMSKKTQDSNNHVGGGIVIESEILQVPHPRMSERDFVLAPLCDLEKEVLHPSIKISAKDLLDSLNDSINSLDEDNQPVATQVLPLPRGRMLCFNETHIMGILNVTPDSFSDGGNYKGSIEIAVEQALKMEIDGASIIDIGGESTRPGAKEVEIDVELERTIPVIRKIREGKDE
jgi:2-amino-4-hydroxy-6-hydroxymethyldihydropteridine diphosphokinase